jgi:branched-chain amino acid transport system permease protein
MNWTLARLPGSLLTKNRRWALILGGLACIPLITDNPYYLKTFTIFFIYSIFAMSWDLIGGYLGIVSFGHALFFGVAAYTTAILNVKLNWPPLLNFPLSILCAVIISLIVATPTIRLRGHYLALVTFAFPIIITNILYAFPNFFGADLGIPGLSRLSASRTRDFYIAYSFVWIIFFFLRRMIRSNTGLVLRAIQSNEVAPTNCGIDTAKIKLKMFVLSGMLAGAAGFLYAHVIKIAAPANLEVHMSVEALVMCIIGGVGTLSGPILGAVIVTIVNELLRVIEQYRILAYHLLVLIIVLFFPKGLSWYLDAAFNFFWRGVRRRSAGTGRVGG